MKQITSLRCEKKAMNKDGSRRADLRRRMEAEEEAEATEGFRTALKRTNKTEEEARRTIAD